MTWASAADVLAITGASATAPEVAAGNAVITIYANRTPDASAGMSGRDLSWLRQAASWQTVWQRDQPGFNARSVVSGYSQDGLSVQHRADWNVSLAPLAARSLKNLSWKASRTLRTPSVLVPTGAAGVDFTLETSDQWSDWEE